MATRRSTLLGLTAAATAVVALLFSGASRAEDLIKIAVTNGPHAQIAEVAKKVAARDGLTLQIVEFSDYVQPNAALDAGDVQANSYQHRPFLQSSGHRTRTAPGCRSWSAPSSRPRSGSSWPSASPIRWSWRSEHRTQPDANLNSGHASRRRFSV